MAELLDRQDWPRLPEPVDDGAAHHLLGVSMPDLSLPAADGRSVNLAALKGITVVYAYPRTGRPGVADPQGWDLTRGARGCTLQSCAFRDHVAEMKAVGLGHLFGPSTQDTNQREAAERLHLPFPLLSDHGLTPTRALGGRTV